MTQTPTRTEIYAQLDQIALWITEIQDVSRRDASNLVLIQNNLEAALEGAFIGESLDLIKEDRAAISGILTREGIAAKLRPVLQEVMRSDGAEPDQDDAAMLQRWRELITADAQSFQTRGITFGSGGADGDGFTDVSGTGDGDIYRVTVDADGRTREGITPETKRFECVRDQQSGTSKHEEAFRVTGTKAQPDNLESAANNMGSDIDEELIAKSAGDSTTIIQNPSFSDHAGADPTAGNDTVFANADDLTGYTIDTPANVAASVDQVFREIPGEALSRSIRLTGNVQIRQQINLTTNFQFVRENPYFRAIRLYRANSADGTFNFDLGSDTYSVDVSLLSNAAWNLVIAPRDQSLFYDNFNTNNLTLNLQWSSRTTGDIYLDDQVIAEGTPIDGTWFFALGGATPFLTEKLFTLLDVESTSPLAKIARLMWLAFGEDGYLTVSGAPTHADP